VTPPTLKDLLIHGTDRNEEDILNLVGVWPKFEIVNCVMYAAIFSKYT